MPIIGRHKMTSTDSTASSTSRTPNTTSPGYGPSPVRSVSGTSDNWPGSNCNIANSTGNTINNNNNNNHNNNNNMNSVNSSANGGVGPAAPARRRIPPPRIGLLRHISGFLESRKDLMNDWEIGGTQNKWVCPSDRHLQLRAQLKSGWSVRTATARSPTNSKGANGSISEAEQEHIRQVLAKAEESRQKEQQRIGKMVDRLEKMRRRATGNGVTHCLLCHTEFGLLASKSYAAMCVDCRKYVCQRNCGVETLDPSRGEVVFLCKICSEAREVLWKKSGAWFYKEMPDFVRPELGVACGNGAVVSPPPSLGGPGGAASSAFSAPRQPQWAINAGASSSSATATAAPSSLSQSNGSVAGGHRRLPAAPADPRPKSPRPRIQPSWVKEKVMSSMSVDDEDRSSSDGEGFAQSGVIRRSHKAHTTARREANLARFALHATRITDSEDESSPESRGSTHSTTSPRRSLATPSSYDAPQTQDVTHDDARSIDSGVVQSDHSNPRASGALTMSSSSLTPFNNVGPTTAAANRDGDALSSPRRISHPDSGIPRVTQSSSGTSLVTPPPSLPPRGASVDQRTSSPAHTAEHKASNASSASSGGFRRLTNSMDPTFSMEPIRQGPPATIRSDSPSTAFMSSPDDDSKLRNRRRDGVARIDSLPNRGKSAEEGATTTADVAVTSSSQQTSAAKVSFDEGTNDAECDPTPTVARRQRSNSTSDGDRPEATSSAEQGSRGRGTRSRRLFACFFSSFQRRTLGSIQFTVTYENNEKKLVIHLQRAKNLKAMDSNGFSDPYVKLHLLPGNAKATKLTSKTIEKTLNPEWNEQLVYYGVTEEDKLKKTLRVTVLDRDRIGSDFLGETRIALRKLPNNQMKKFNLYLEHAIPVPQQKEEEAERGKIHVGLQYNIQQGSLFVSLNRCVELIGMDSTGFSDPYCKVSLTPITSKAHRQRTAIKKRTLNPEFAETLQFVVPFKDLPKKTLQVGVYDHDLGKHDDYIGGIVLSASAKDERGKQWISCMENPGTLVEAWHKLELDS